MAPARVPRFGLRHVRRHFKFEIRLGRLDGQPEIPIQRGRLLQSALSCSGPCGQIGRFVHRRISFKRADGALVDPFLGEALAFHGAALVAHLREHAGLLGRAMQVANFPDRVAERLLHADRLLVLERPHRGRRSACGPAWRRSPHRCPSPSLEHLAEVREGLGAGYFCFALSRVFGIHVDDGDDVVERPPGACCSGLRRRRNRMPPFRPRRCTRRAACCSERRRPGCAGCSGRTWRRPRLQRSW